MQVSLNDLPVGHPLVGIVDLVQSKGLSEDLAWVDLAIQNGLQQNFLVVGRHRRRTASQRNILVEGLRWVQFSSVWQADTADY